MKKLLFSILLLNIFCASAQKISTDISPGLNTMSTLGMVKNLDNNNKSVQSIFVLHGLHYFSDDFSILKYQLSEIEIKDEAVIKKIYDFDDVLLPNEHLLQQIIKDTIWYFIGYDIINDSTKRYFLKQMSIIDNKLLFTENTVYSAPKTSFSRPLITKARVLDDNRISFCGRKKTDREDTMASLFLIFDEKKGELFEVDTPGLDEVNVVKFFHDAFIANDTLYGHYILG